MTRCAWTFDEDARWLLVHRGALLIAANLGDGPVEIPVASGAAGPGPVVLGSDPGISVAPGAIALPRGILRDHRREHVRRAKHGT